MCWVTYFDTANSLFQKEAPRILDVGRSVGIANLTIWWWGMATFVIHKMKRYLTYLVKYQVLCYLNSLKIIFYY